MFSTKKLLLGILMAISLVSGGAIANSTINGTDVTLTLPGGLAENDVVYIGGGFGRAGNTGVSTGGYTELVETQYGISPQRTGFSVSRKVMGATPDASAVCLGSGNTNDAAAYAAICLRGVDTTTPEDATTTVTGDIAAPDSPSIVTVTDNAWVLSLVGAEIFDSNVTEPTGYENKAHSSSNDNRKATVGGATKLIVSAGTEDPSAWTGWTNGLNTATTVAVRPAIEAVNLVVQNSVHSQTADNIGLTQVHELAVQNASHAHTSNNIALTQLHLITVQDTLHSHTVENVVLTQTHNLTVQDAAHVHTADNITLTQLHLLAVDNALHAHIGENVVLTQLHNLIVDSSLHAHIADNVAITQVTPLIVADALHGHIADNITLSQLHLLTVQDALHNHTADNLVLTQLHQLIIDAAQHSQTADNIDLTQFNNLTLQDAIHSHSADNIVLTQLHLLNVNNATHGHTADNVVLTLANNKIFIGANVVQDIFIGATPVTKVYLGSDLLGNF